MKRDLKMSSAAALSFVLALFLLMSACASQSGDDQITVHTHSYTEEVFAATCLDGGYTIYTCSCGYSYKGNETPASGDHGTIASGRCWVCKKLPIPAFAEESQEVKPYSCGDNNYLLAYSQVSAGGVSAYEEALNSAGYSLVQSNEIGDNRFATYTKDDLMIHCSYFAAEEEYRITYGPKTYLGAMEAVTGYDELVTPSVSMIEIGGTGLSMVIQLADGSFVIVDGGFGQGTYDNAAITEADISRMYQFLKSKTPGGGKPQITWMITHADSDHILFSIGFMNEHKEDVNVNTVCYNFPPYNSVKNNSVGFKDCVSKHYPNANHYIMHTGSKLYLPGCEIEFLITASEDLYPTAFKSGNHTCNAWRITVEGKTILITGDIETPLCNKMVKNYGNYLASNILQVVHHGVNGPTVEFNTCVASGSAEAGNKLEICFWPIRSERIFRTEQYPDINKPLWTSGAAHYYHDYTTVIELPDLNKK